MLVSMAVAQMSLEQLVKRLSMIQAGIDDMEKIPNWQTQWATPHQDLVVARSEVLALLARSSSAAAQPVVTQFHRGAGFAPTLQHPMQHHPPARASAACASAEAEQKMLTPRGSVGTFWPIDLDQQVDMEVEPTPAAAAIPYGPCVLGLQLPSGAAGAAAEMEYLAHKGPGWAEASQLISNFDGACGAAQEPPKQHMCDQCGNGYPLAHAIALVHADDRTFAKTVNADIYKAIRETQKAYAKFQNLVDGRPVCHVCAWCMNKNHGVDTYVETIKVPGTERVVERATSKFVNLAKASKGMSRGKVTEDRTMKFFDEKAERLMKAGRIVDISGKVIQEVRSSAAIFKALKDSPDFRVSVDWHTEIAGGTVRIHYGCWVCGTWTVASNTWWRMIRSKIGDLRDGLSDPLAGCFWACGECCEEWTWGTGGHKRLIMIKNAEGKTHFATVGETQGTDLENLIHFLKAARALSYLNGRALTKVNIMALLAEVHVLAVRQLREQIPGQLRTARSADPQLKYNERGIRWYCESPVLSLNKIGAKYDVIDKKLIEGPVEEISLKTLEYILLAAAATLDIEQCPPEGPAAAAAKKKVLTSELFHTARSVIYDKFSKY